MITDFITSGMSPEEKRAAVIFSTFSSNGYIRQRAVEYLGKFEATLPFVIPRLNDWVGEVRQTAFDSFSEGLKVASEQELLQSISLIDRLRRSTRCAYPEIAHLFDTVINDPANIHIVEDGLFDSNSGIRNACLRILLRSPEKNREILRKYILRGKDPLSRKTAFESLIKTDLDVSDLADALLTDKYSGVRYAALKYLDDLDRKDIFRKAESLLTDKNAFVREFSRSLITKTDPGFDFLNFYMERQNPHTAVAILGLGEVGSPAICEMIEPYLKSDRVDVIRASMISLMRLDPRRYGAVIPEMLLSGHGGIVKTAKELIQKYRIHDYDRIEEIFSMTPYGSTKMKCAALLFSAGKWQRMIYILRFMSDKHEPLRNMCRTQFIRWFGTYNRSFSAPTEEQKTTILKLLREQESYLSESALAHLRLVLTL
ncbi:MAG: HEAT repeat domain-containing protein [Clostridiaceae bacterium]|nr:HEAT repeat domain-containing protein [Clostridiaceae bacterium]